jgi:hypothetical protein
MHRSARTDNKLLLISFKKYKKKNVLHFMCSFSFFVFNLKLFTKSYMWNSANESVSLMQVEEMKEKKLLKFYDFIIIMIIELLASAFDFRVCYWGVFWGAGERSVYGMIDSYFYWKMKHNLKYCIGQGSLSLKILYRYRCSRLFQIVHNSDRESMILVLREYFTGELFFI